jgi:hypothetical protein
LTRIPNTLGRLIGYHGCDRSVAEQVLAGKDEIHYSTNSYDWLGHGSYFWVDSPMRALQWAEQQKIKDEAKAPTHRHPVKHPYVVGAFINSGLCLNLLDIQIMPEIGQAYDGLCDILAEAKYPIPFNVGHKKGVSYQRNLDCTVFEFVHFFRLRNREPSYDTVLGIFSEGEGPYVGAGFQSRTHVQIAVRNLQCIIGYFRVKELDMAAYVDDSI